MRARLREKMPVLIFWSGWRRWSWGKSPIGFIEFAWIFDIGPIRLVRKQSRYAAFRKDSTH